MECETRGFRAACSELSGLTRVWAEEPARGTIAGRAQGAGVELRTGTRWDECDWARPLDISPSAWAGGKHAAGTEAAGSAV